MSKHTLLALTGDVMLGRGVDAAIGPRGPSYPFGNTLAELRRADLRLINLECVIALSGKEWTRTPKVFFFRAAPAAIDALKLARIDYVSLANNHTLDFEEPALLETLVRLKEAGIAAAGAGRDRREASAPARLTAGELRLAVISTTDNEPAWKADADKPGVNYRPALTAAPEFKELRRTVAAAAALADFVIVSAHWGPNMVERPPPEFRTCARALIDAGADLFHGHSAHIFQGIEIHRGCPILYDTGDFIDDYVVDPELRNDLSFLFLTTVEPDGRPSQLELVPTAIDDYQVNLARGADADWALARMARLCREMGTPVRTAGGRLFVDIAREERTRTAA